MDDLQAADYADGPIKTTTAFYRVGVRSHDQRRQGFSSRAPSDQVTGRVQLYTQLGCFHLLLQPEACCFVHPGERASGKTGLIQIGERPER